MKKSDDKENERSNQSGDERSGTIGEKKNN